MQLYLKGLLENSSWRSILGVQCAQGFTEGALPGYTKPESFRTKRYILSKFYFVLCFILLFLLRNFFKIVGELLHLLILHPELIFWDAIKRALWPHKIGLIQHNTSSMYKCRYWYTFFRHFLDFNFFVFSTKNRVFIIFLHYLYYSFIVFISIIFIF